VPAERHPLADLADHAKADLRLRGHAVADHADAVADPLCGGSRVYDVRRGLATDQSVASS
jgi:hypothetical protein